MLELSDESSDAGAEELFVDARCREEHKERECDEVVFEVEELVMLKKGLEGGVDDLAELQHLRESRVLIAEQHE